MPFERALQRLVRLRRIENGLGNRALIGERQADDVVFLDRLDRGLARRRHDEIGESAPLDLGSTLEYLQHVGWKARLKSGGRNSFSLGHAITYGNSPYKTSASKLLAARSWSLRSSPSRRARHSRLIGQPGDEFADPLVACECCRPTNDM